MVCASNFSAKRAIEVLKKHVSATEAIRDVNPIFVATLPFLERHKFANLFEELESFKTYLGIVSFHLEGAVMEDVFRGVCFLFNT